MATSFLNLPTVSQGTLITASDWNNMVNKLDEVIKKIMVTEKIVKVLAPSVTIQSLSAGYKGWNFSLTLPAASTYDFIKVKLVGNVIGVSSIYGPSSSFSYGGAVTSATEFVIPKGDSLPLLYIIKHSTNYTTEATLTKINFTISGTSATCSASYGNGDIDHQYTMQLVSQIYEFYKYTVVSPS